jgi:hypothetical protein
MVLALNTVSGQIADIPPKMLLHPKFRDILVPVDENAKPYNSAMYKPGTVAEKTEKRVVSGIFSFKKKEEEPEEELLLTAEEVFEHLDEVDAQESESNIDIEEEN